MKALYSWHSLDLDSLESKSAAMQLLGSLKTSFFAWRAADQQELMGCVHELKLLMWKKEAKRAQTKYN